MTDRWENRAGAALCLGCALLALLLASTGSPLYATNFWTDTNVYFTIGRGMNAGLAPYKDLFDHKGPLLFDIYALGAAIRMDGFLGVFMLEVLSLAAALFAGFKLARLYGQGRLTLLCIPMQALVTVCCTAFNQGGSAEEFCLPALVLALYAVLRRMHEGEGCAHAARLYAAFGAATAWVFLIKFTCCGLFFGLAAMLFCFEWMLRGLGRAVHLACYALAGFAALLVPVALMLWAQGALESCIQVYLYQNLFEYGGDPMTLPAHLYNALAYLRTQSAANPVVALLAACGICFAALSAMIRGGRGRAFHALATPLAAGLLLLFVYWGEMAHPYYALVFAALCPLGLAPLCALAQHMRGRGDAAAVCVSLVCMAAIVPVCYALCQAVPLLDVKRADMPQTRFAAVMRRTPNATLLDITSLDQGFYLAAGIVPDCRYFADNNLQTEEKKQAIGGYLADANTDYVVTRYADPGERYVLIDEAQGVFDLNDMRTYRLYRRAQE